MIHIYIAYALEFAARYLDASVFGVPQNLCDCNGIGIFSCGESAELSARKPQTAARNVDGFACRNRHGGIVLHGQITRYYIQTVRQTAARHTRNVLGDQLAVAGNGDITDVGTDACGKCFLDIIRIFGIKCLAADSGERSARN